MTDKLEAKLKSLGNVYGKLLGWDSRKPSGQGYFWRMPWTLPTAYLKELGCRDEEIEILRRAEGNSFDPHSSKPTTEQRSEAEKRYGELLNECRNLLIKRATL